MTYLNAWHVAYLVEDLEKAMYDFSKALGVTFREPTTNNIKEAIDYVDLSGYENKEVHEYPVRFTYSNEGPPYHELLEAREGGIAGHHHGEGFHHVGLWVPDNESFRQQMEEQGVRTEARFLGPGGITLTWFNTPASLHNVRMEYIDEVWRPEAEEWLAGRGGLTLAEGE